MPELLWQYLLVFLAAATPWLEIIIVIPVAIGLGLAPLPVTVVNNESAVHWIARPRSRASGAIQ